MEGVGARLGRSSTRYGPATVFTGPVRKWKKKWVHVSPNHHHHHHSSRHHAAADAHAANGSAAAAANGSNSSHLLLYKWTPISQSGTLNGNSDREGLEKGSVKEDDEPPRRKFKYIPLTGSSKVSGVRFACVFGIVLSGLFRIQRPKLRKNVRHPESRKSRYNPEADRNVSQIVILEETKTEEESVGAGNVDEESKPNPMNEVPDEKSDINDVPMEENEDGNQGMRQDLNETLDLTL